MRRSPMMKLVLLNRANRNHCNHTLSGLPRCGVGGDARSGCRVLDWQLMIPKIKSHTYEMRNSNRAREIVKEYKLDNEIIKGLLIIGGRVKCSARL